MARALKLRSGDWVVVRSREEILATLDERGCLDALPFQPEMFAFCGRRMRVAAVAHKTCDTIHRTGGRRMLDAVHLEGSRCDGSRHGGCQAFCLFFWKTAWLRRPDESSVSAVPATAAGASEDAVERAVCTAESAGGSDPVWVCQATALFRATKALHWWDVRQYARDVASGNQKARHMAALLLAAAYRNLVRLGVGYRLLLAFYNGFQRLRGGRPFPVISGVIEPGKPTPTGTLGLQPGEWVQVKLAAEIRATLNRNGFNRGMRFDEEMLAYCGARHRVLRRVERLINEQTGRMMQMKEPCIQLEDVYCRSECSPKRLGCPRAIMSYWREIWLRRTP